MRATRTIRSIMGGKGSTMSVANWSSSESRALWWALACKAGHQWQSAYLVEERGGHEEEVEPVPIVLMQSEAIRSNQRKLGSNESANGS